MLILTTENFPKTIKIDYLDVLIIFLSKLQKKVLRILLETNTHPKNKTLFKL